MDQCLTLDLPFELPHSMWHWLTEFSIWSMFTVMRYFGEFVCIDQWLLLLVLLILPDVVGLWRLRRQLDRPAQN